MMGPKFRRQRVAASNGARSKTLHRSHVVIDGLPTLNAFNANFFPETLAVQLTIDAILNGVVKSRDQFDASSSLKTPYTQRKRSAIDENIDVVVTCQIIQHLSVIARAPRAFLQ